ncbi:MAG: hypothetical protein QOJ71_239 [Actinomycetota bacterium]|jgi:hypothetical protein|nr:hypothetical protein [Actinomycetota bacterium]
MNERVSSTSARVKVARRNYIVFCGAAPIVTAFVLLPVVTLLGTE